MKPRKVVFVTAGTRGDVLPFFFAAQVFKARGWNTVVNASADHEVLAEKLDICFSPNPLPAQNSTIRDTLPNGQGFEVMEFLKRVVWAPEASWYSLRINHLLDICKDADLIVCQAWLLLGIASTISQYYNLPLVAVQIYPVMPTRCVPCCLTPSQVSRLSFKLKNIFPHMSGLLNYFSYHYYYIRHQWRFESAMLNNFRSKLSMTRTTEHVMYYANPNVSTVIGAWSPIIFNPTDWKYGAVTGFWHSCFSIDEPLSPEVETFFGHGEPPICIGWGSFSKTLSTEFLFNLIVYSTYLSSSRALVLCGWSDIDTANLLQAFPPDMVAHARQNICVCKYAPHSKIFPRCEMIIHHGGAGTTGDALRYGKIQLITPVLREQFLWQMACVDLGISVSLPGLINITPKQLSDGILRMRESPECRLRARMLRETQDRQDMALQTFGELCEGLLS
mmetsp:Transcript_25314/g.86706  ORF Transcript_25314/g.86706 Transcript_25314/m.86706 type:complete len:447 (-) Transcript_25314:443-1783(-)|eukprot:CAMPEP_0183823022 /NCGR_PEP_ID=MMETSP0803_2-20130417/65934_1 /TAXON_ID=195967 /ORGANISM="Crustomastix stigmata, Strain CCMP3273" /LENGTH=446 /DNA_ID=CAMNT_0026067915 /DNA_START=133 /DNA_END=1473 /DNA_ORIENTATION=-